MKKYICKVVNECNLGDIIEFTVEDFLDGYDAAYTYNHHGLKRRDAPIAVDKDKKIKVCGLIASKGYDDPVGYVEIIPISRKGRYDEFAVSLNRQVINYGHLPEHYTLHADTLVRVSNASSCKNLGYVLDYKMNEVLAALEAARVQGALQYLVCK